jgi:hypothetical protein
MKGGRLVGRLEGRLGGRLGGNASRSLKGRGLCGEALKLGVDLLEKGCYELIGKLALAPLKGGSCVREGLGDFISSRFEVCPAILTKELADLLYSG